MDEYIKKDYHYSTRYALIKNGKRIEFNSEQEACEFLGVKNVRLRLALEKVASAKDMK